MANVFVINIFFFTCPSNRDATMVLVLSCPCVCPRRFSIASYIDLVEFQCELMVLGENQSRTNETLANKYASLSRE